MYIAVHQDSYACGCVEDAWLALGVLCSRVSTITHHVKKDVHH